jgi:hypothetical protein
MYVNGVCENQTAYNSGIFPGTNDLLIGAAVASRGQIISPFAGLIDEAAVYSRALSATEIAAIYNAGSAGKCQTPVPPSIQTQPQSQMVAVGASASLSVVAAGTPPLSYQWRFNSTNIAATTGSVLTLANVQLTNAGSYDVVVTNLYGSTNSSAATLTVLIPPQITGQPQDQSVRVGSNVTFTVTATGSSPLTYQWYFNGASLSTATNSSLLLNGVSLNQAGSYSVSVSNVVGSVSSRNAILVVVGNGSCASPPAGLVSWWPGEGNAQDIVDGNSGVLVNGVTFALGRVGQAFSFNGTSSYVQIADNPNLHFTNALTIEAWIYPTTLSGTHNIVSKWDWPGVNAQVSYTTAVNPGGQLGFGVCNVGNCSSYPGVLSTNLIPVNQWTHFAATYDGSYLRMYVNGVCQNQTAYNGGIFPGTNDLLIGAAVASRGQIISPFAGLIDEVAVYNRALSATEIAAIYNAGSAGKCAPAPSILTPPQSQTVQCSSNASFSVSATGLAPFAYQWYFGANLIPGATNTLLTLTNACFAQAGNYSVVVTNAYGSATGGPAVLTVVDTIPPTIISCASNQTLSVGANCTATLPDLTAEVVAWDASGPVTVTQSPPPGTLLGLGVTNVTFTVRDSSGNASVCANSVTAVDTTPPFILACVLQVTLGFDTNCQALLPDLTGTNYIIASDNCSSVSVAQAPPTLTALPVGTNTVLLTVSDSASNQTTRTVAVIVPSEPHIAVQPADLTLAVGSNATFSVLACGAAPLLYQWQCFSTNLPAATNAVLTLSNISTNDAGDYRVVITNSFGSITSAVATLTVLQPPVITWQPGSVVAAPGATVDFSVEAEGLAPLAYQWQKDGAPLAGQTDAWLIITNIQAGNFGSYTVGITNSDGGVLSEVARLTLAASPRINSLGFNLTTFMFTVPTEVGPIYVVEYKDTLEDPAWHQLTILAGTGSSIPISDNGLTNTTRFYRVRVQ